MIGFYHHCESTVASKLRNKPNNLHRSQKEAQGSQSSSWVLLPRAQFLQSIGLFSDEWGKGRLDCESCSFDSRRKKTSLYLVDKLKS